MIKDTYGEYPGYNACVYTFIMMYGGSTMQL